MSRVIEYQPTDMAIGRIEGAQSLVDDLKNKVIQMDRDIKDWVEQMKSNGVAAVLPYDHHSHYGGASFTDVKAYYADAQLVFNDMIAIGNPYDYILARVNGFDDGSPAMYTYDADNVIRVQRKERNIWLND